MRTTSTAALTSSWPELYSPKIHSAVEQTRDDLRGRGARGRESVSEVHASAKGSAESDSGRKLLKQLGPAPLGMISHSFSANFGERLFNSHVADPRSHTRVPSHHRRAPDLVECVAQALQDGGAQPRVGLHDLTHKKHDLRGTASANALGAPRTPQPSFKHCTR